ncbi:hypothetical protein [Streptomyces sp. G1]|uniref:hypothetical protein n=1 Tax=Streptomyces sp. G1 TaxID=361572 RepID=UPI00202FA012|nr:hypothetical protein [Streptomyces sp. G1]MCM1965709.1 hypothetical protein [Streptomyces sp. G1]
MSTYTRQSLTVTWGSEQVLVSNVGQDLPIPPTDDVVDRVVEAGRANPATLLTEDAWRAVGRGAMDAEGVAVQLHPTRHDPGGVLMVENVEGATLRSLVTRVYLSELFPGIQPRTGMEASEIPDPQIQGVTEDGRPCATVGYRFKNFTHLRDHVWQTIHGTLSLNNYVTSILARTITRNLIVHPVEISFEDGTESFHVLGVRDGITRLTSAWAVLAGPRAESNEVADLAVNSLFGEADAALPPGVPVGRHLATVRENFRQSLRKEYEQAMEAAEPARRGVEIGQTFIAPAQITVGIEGHTGHLLAAEDLFDDAIRSVLASVHVEFKPWTDAAQNVEVMTRALKRVIQQGESLIPQDDLQAVYGLSVGRSASADLPELFPGTNPPPGTPLWRSVYVVHALTRPELLERLKDQAKAIKGGKRMGLKGFAELLGPIVDLPWRSHKKLVTKQARNAWNNGGVLTPVVVGEWDPVPTDDFTTLVEPAMAGDIDALCTLAVAGGTALIADKLLTRNVGSALLADKEKGGVPFRADVSQIIEGLSQPENELGLWILARVANAFRSNALPENAVTMRALTSKPGSGEEGGSPYIHFNVDLAEKDKTARDADGVPQPLYQWDVVYAAYPERARKNTLPGTGLTDSALVPEPRTEASGDAAAGEDGQDSADGDQPEAPLFSDAVDARPASQRAADHRAVLRQSVTAALDAMDRLHQLEPEVAGHTPIVPLSALDELHSQLISLQTDIENLRRRITQGEEADTEYDGDEEPRGAFA